MNFGFKYFTSESVLPGHPDKIADQISDLILDEYLRHDNTSRTAIEVLVTHKKIIVAGEVKGPTIHKNEMEQKIREFLQSLGYSKDLLDFENIQIVNLLHGQSDEIAIGIRSSPVRGAGDQGIMFGYATDETEDFMPAPIYYANKILHSIKTNTNLGPDGKSQITIEYDKEKGAVCAANIVVSVQHTHGLSQKNVREIVYPHIKNSLPDGWMCGDENIFINPTGMFTKGGPISDCGLTGRKIVVDTYGGMIQNGGGAFSGKDATKVDRSAAYMARYIAKNIVAAKLAKCCNVQLCYAIGVDHPLSFQINTYGTSVVAESKILQFIQKKIDLSPYGMAKHLHLESPIYLPTATYGHFGRRYDKNKNLFMWERLDLSEEMSAYFKTNFTEKEPAQHSQDACSAFL